MITTLFSRLLFLICILGGCDSMHMCPNGNCYVEEDKCDGYNDCRDSTDEIKCRWHNNCRNSTDKVCRGHKRKHNSKHFIAFCTL